MPDILCLEFYINGLESVFYGVSLYFLHIRRSKERSTLELTVQVFSF